MGKRNYVLNEAKMFADVSEGTAIIINSLTGIYYGMNAFGTSIFENLMAGSSVEDVIAAAKALPGADDTLPGNVEAFVDEILKMEIILPSEELPSRDATIEVKVASEDGFKPECVEYKDVQELLYADPIHEVDAEEGWKPE